VPDARLSDELISKLNGFPLEVHAVLIQLPPTEDKQKQFDTLSQRMRNALHQRLYHALVLLRHGVRQREAGKAAAFRSSPGYQTLRGYAANFRLRLPTLRSLFARLGFVVDLAEAAGLELGSSAHMRFPEQGFTRAWGQFAAHVAVAGWLTARRQKGFDPARYWGQVDTGLRDGLHAGASLSPAAAAQARIVYLLRRYHQRSAEPGLQQLVAQLKGSLGTFRFAIYQASQPPKAPAAGAGAPSQEEDLDSIVAALWEARQGQEKHALEMGADGKLH
jgi:hypothetical protein